MVVLQVLVIQMFLLVMIGAVTMIGVAGTITTRPDRWQDGMVNGDGTPSGSVSDAESPSFTKAIRQTSYPAPFDRESNLKNTDPLE